MKGRSSSARLNGVLRASVPDYIGFDLHCGYMYVASADTIRRTTPLVGNRYEFLPKIPLAGCRRLYEENMRP